MFVGELWADEVSEAEANSITSRVSAESIPCDNGADSSGQKSMPAAKGASQSLHRDAARRRITGKDGGAKMGARRSGSRISIVVLAILALTLIAVSAVLIATGAFASHLRIAPSTGTRGPLGRARPASPPTSLPRLMPTPTVSPTTTMSSPLPSSTSRPVRTTRASITLQAIPMTNTASAPMWLPSRAGRRVTTFRHSSRPMLRGVQRPMRSRFRIRRSISAARPISRSFSMLMRSAWQTMPMKSPNGAVGTLSCMRGTSGLSPTVAMSAAFRTSFIILGRFSCAMRKTSCKAMDTSSGIIAWIPHASRCCHRAQIRMIPLPDLGSSSKVAPQ